LFGANYVATGTTGPGSGFTSRTITQPDEDIAEDEMVTAVGSYSATAPVSPAGDWIMQMVAFRTSSTPPPPPTAPANLTATPASLTQINLSWTASTSPVGIANYIVQRCQGTGCSNFAQIATTTATSYNDTGLSNTVTYSYRVQAEDTLGQLSGFSNIATATPQATQPPTTPTNLTATAVSPSQINLTWTASTDPLGVTGYNVQRCQGAGCTNFAQVGTSTTTSYSDTGLMANTSYSYQVQAVDSVGNLSGFSNTATATTLTVVSGLVAAYSFDEGTGSTVTDSSGNGNTGTVSDALWVSGKYGSAISFSSNSTLVTIPDASVLHLSSAMTLEAWVDLYGVGNVYNAVIYKGYENYYLQATTPQNDFPGGGGTFGSTDLVVYGAAPSPRFSSHCGNRAFRITVMLTARNARLTMP
jgi:fibronectin type 3 domain-containing protein